MRGAGQRTGNCAVHWRLRWQHAVEINNLILGVTIALGTQPVTACPAFDCQHDGTVPINCLIQGVNNALSGCAPVPTATATVAAPTATTTAALPTSTATLAQATATPTATTTTVTQATATPTVAPTTTSTPSSGYSCSIATAGCSTTACTCDVDPGTDYHINASGSVMGPVGTELRVNINAPQGGMLDCGGWTRIFGNVVTGCDTIGCCQRQAGEPEMVQWTVFEVIDLPCMCPAAPNPGFLLHNFLIQCQLRPQPVMEVERTSTGCP